MNIKSFQDIITHDEYLRVISKAEETSKLINGWQKSQF